MTKKCIKCHQIKGMNCFRKSQGYYRNKCKDCSKKETYNWRDSNKNSYRAIAKKSYQKNKEQILEIMKDKYKNLDPEIKNEIIDKAMKNAKANIDRVRKASRKNFLMKKYNLTVEEHENMIKAQDGKCAICKEIPKTSKSNLTGYCVDHCHKTGKVRGILCDRCNLALGYLKDDIEILNNAIKYLNNSNLS